MGVEILLNSVTAFLAQSFLTFRIWRLSNSNRWLTFTSLFLVLAEFASILWYVFTSSSWVRSTEWRLPTNRDLILAASTLGAIVDLFIATALCVLLLRSRTSFSRSDTMIKRLVIFFMNTGLLTSFSALATIISVAVAPTKFWFIFFYLLMGRLYSNSMLAILNSRESIRNPSDGILTACDMPIFWRRSQASTTQHEPGEVITINPVHDSLQADERMNTSRSSEKLKRPSSLHSGGDSELIILSAASDPAKVQGVL
ncbi:hypothetical protein C8J57DRAFT_1299328 [Mycena rebaudengoi]|nr:hypothetical protein C8J57DRAFT_1299328 [Mycena rebaudengoi]